MLPKQQSLQPRNLNYTTIYINYIHSMVVNQILDEMWINLVAIAAWIVHSDTTECAYPNLCRYQLAAHFRKENI